MSNYISHETTDVITYPWPDLSYSLFIKEAPVDNHIVVF